MVSDDNMAHLQVGKAQRCCVSQQRRLLTQFFAPLFLRALLTAGEPFLILLAIRNNQAIMVRL